MDFNLKCGLTVISWQALFFVLKNATKKPEQNAPVCIFNPGLAGLFRLLCLKFCFLNFHFIVLSSILSGVVDVF